MIFTKKIRLDGSQAYNVTADDVIVVKVKGQDEFKYKVPDNWQGNITVTIKGDLEEINPT